MIYCYKLSIQHFFHFFFIFIGCVAFGTCAHCKPLDGGAKVKLKHLTLKSAPNLVNFPFQHASVLYDEDGTLTGHRGGRVLPHTALLDPAACQQSPSVSFGVSGAVCKRGDFATVVWNKIKPSSIDEKDAYLCNDHGCDTVIWRKKSKTLPSGWTAFLPINATTDLSFQNSSQLTNISYHMEIYEMQPNDFAHIRHTVKQMPDYFKTTNKNTNNTKGAWVNL